MSLEEKIKAKAEKIHQMYEQENIPNHIKEKLQAYRSFVVYDVLELLKDVVCIKRKKLEDYIDFVDNQRTHPQSHVMSVKYQIYKDLLKGDAPQGSKIEELNAKINKLPKCEERDNLIKQREIFKLIKDAPQKGDSE